MLGAPSRADTERREKTSMAVELGLVGARSNPMHGERTSSLEVSTLPQPPKAPPAQG